MSSTHNRRVKQIQLGIGGNQFECQVESWQMLNNTPDGEKRFGLCPDGEFREETDDDYALQLTFFADWRSNGISDYLTQHDKETVAFQLDHLPDIVGEHVRWTGELVLKAPNVGGGGRATETFETTLLVIGKPDYSRP